MSYIHVILPLRLEWTPSYCSGQKLCPGQIVSVQFASRRYLGVVWHTDIEPDVETDKIQPIIAVEEQLPSISKEELRLWEFISEYYMCSIGEVYKAAYPGRKLRSEENAASALERLKRKLSAIELDLEKKHCERVRLRLETERKEIAAKIRMAEKMPEEKVCKEKPGKATLYIENNRIDNYIKALRAMPEDRRQALILCPEKSFCEKMAKALEPQFGEQIHLAHSQQSPAALRAAAKALRQAEPAIIIGARSAIFLPFSRLSLVIIDEEQDISFKQGEPAPRYNGRDCAIFLAGLHSAQVILGSACPSLESLHNSLSGKYECRHGLSSKTECEIIDIAAEKRKNGMLGAFSRKAIKAISEHEGHVVLLRGWEKEEELQKAAEELFPGKELEIVRFAELKQKGCPEDSLLLVIQADALVSKDDFRSDERALQILSLLKAMSGRLIVQTSVPQRFDPDKDTASLLKERKDFSFPPYTRLIEKRRKGSGELVARFFLQKDSSLLREKKKIASTLESWCYLDVDPQ